MQLQFNRDIIYKEGGITIYNARQSLWYERYSDKVDIMTKYYERLNAENAKTNTIVSIATPEEMKMYEERRNKTDCHRLHIKQK